MPTTIPSVRRSTGLRALGVVLVGLSWPSTTSAQCLEATLAPLHHQDLADFGTGLAAFEFAGRPRALIGVPGLGARGHDAGFVAVFDRDDGGVWSQVASLAPDPTTSDGARRFGAAIAVATGGDEAYAAIGAPAFPRGRVHLYRAARGGPFEQIALLRSPGAAVNDRFGSSIAIECDAEGCTLLVGAPGYGRGRSREERGRGEAFLMQLDREGDLRFELALGHEGLAPGAAFGHAVDLLRAGSQVWTFVGAPYDVDATGLRLGSVTIAHVSISGTDAIRDGARILKRSPSDGFGTALAAVRRGSENWLAVGAPSSRSRGVDAGAVHLMRDLGSDTWTEDAQLSPAELAAGDRYGRSVALAVRGTELILAVGAPYDDDGAWNRGAVYLYGRQQATWRRLAKAAVEPVGPHGRSGRTIAMSAGAAGIVALFEAPGNDVAGDNAGAVGVLQETGADCNGNGTCDAVEAAEDPARDCNENGILDDCEIADGSVPDLNGDGVPDACNEDCNQNGLPDFIDIAIGIESDCNGNGIPDSCDISFGFSEDDDGDGIPDECG